MYANSGERELRDVDDSPDEETFQILLTGAVGKKTNYQGRHLQELRRRT